MGAGKRPLLVLRCRSRPSRRKLRRTSRFGCEDWTCGRRTVALAAHLALPAVRSAAAAAAACASGERGHRALALGQAALAACSIRGLGPAVKDLASEEARILANGPLDSLSGFGMFLQIGLGVLPSL